MFGDDVMIQFLLQNLQVMTHDKIAFWMISQQGVGVLDNVVYHIY